MINKILHSILFVLLGTTLMSQVEFNSDIILNASQSMNRQVFNLGAPINDSAATPAGNHVKQTYNFGLGDFIGDTLYINTDTSVNSISEGYYIYFQSSSSNNGRTFLKINNASPYELLKFASDTLQSFDIQTQTTYLSVFDSVNFQLINTNPEVCPAGFVAVNKRYCIEIDENTATSFHDAIVNCGDKNASLCSMNEWIYACQNITSLNNIIDNFEWINDAGNSTDHAKVFGENQFGEFGCDKSYTRPTTSSTLNNFRCCYYRK